MIGEIPKANGARLEKSLHGWTVEGGGSLHLARFREEGPPRDGAATRSVLMMSRKMDVVRQRGKRVSPGPAADPIFRF